MSKTKSLDVTPVKRTISDAQKAGWTPGDDLEEKTRAALREDLDTRYLVLGRISDREKERIVAAAVYDLRAGKVVSEGRAILVKPVAPISLPQVTLLFTPHTELRINTFQWFVDDEQRGSKRLSSERAAGSQTVEAAPGKHKFKLIWSGDGYRDKDKDEYKDVTVEEFELDVQKNMSLELSARIIAPPKPLIRLPGPEPRGRLELTARANKQTLHPKWH